PHARHGGGRRARGALAAAAALRPLPGHPARRAGVRSATGRPGRRDDAAPARAAPVVHAADAPRAPGHGRPYGLRQLEAVQVGVEGGYRRAVVSDEVLWRVVEDASLDEKTRAGAAVALRKVLGDEG